MKKQTTKIKKEPRPVPTHLNPYQIIRFRDGAPFFGYEHSQLDELIKQGQIPRPLPLSESGRATGWTGQMIMDHHERLKQLAAKKRGEA